MRASQILSVLVIIGTSSWAQAQVCDGALALRVNQGGLDFIAKQVKPLVPSQIAVPAVTKVVLDWPLTSDDATVQTNAMIAKIKLHDLKLKMVTGSLRLQGRADVTTGGPVTVLNPYASFGSADCQADVQIRDLKLDVGLKLYTSGGRVKVDVTKAYIDLDNKKSVIALKGCTLGKVLTSVVSFLRTYLMGVIQKGVEGIAKDKIPALVAAQLGDSLQMTKEVQGFVVTGRLDSLATDYYGLTAKLGAGISTKSKSIPSCLAGASYLTPPQSCIGPHASVAPKTDAMFGAGVSQAVLNQALYAAWRSGKLCIDSEALKLAALTQGLDKVATTLGQPKGTKLAFSMRLMTPPSIRFTATSGVQLLIKNMSVKMSMTPPGGPVNGAVVTADLAVAVKPWIDPATNSVALDVKQMTVPRLEVGNKDGSPSQLKLDPARLARFLDTVALPVLRQRLSSSQLSPSVLSVKSILLELKLVDVRDGYLAAYLNGHTLTKTGDKTPPQTRVVKRPGSVVGPQMIRLQVAGTDNLTPAALLRFRARVDNGKWSEPAYGGVVEVVTHGGVHVVEVAALDHDGNADPSPVRMTFKVDDKMPQLLVTERPDSLVDTPDVALAFSGRDDLTPADKLVFAVELYRVPDGGGMPQLVDKKLLGAGINKAAFAGLSDGIYKARVMVRDQAGNVTSSDVGFVVAAEGGCNISLASSAAQPLAGLGLLLLALALRRRQRR